MLTHAFKRVLLIQVSEHCAFLICLEAEAPSHRWAATWSNGDDPSGSITCTVMLEVVLYPIFYAEANRRPWASLNE